MKDIHMQAFLIEAIEMIEEIESTMLELENNFHDKELIDRVFRAMHTLKGSGGMFGFDNIKNFTHNIENVFDKIREGDLHLNSKIISCTLSAGDIIRKMVNNEEVLENELKSISHEFDSFLEQNNFKTEENTKEISNVLTVTDAESNSRKNTFVIQFKPIESIFNFGTNPLLLLRELTDLGEYEIKTNHHIPPINDIDPFLCYTSWEITLNTSHSEDEIKGVFIFSEDECGINIKKIEAINEISITNEESNKSTNTQVDIKNLNSVLTQAKESTEKTSNTNPKDASSSLRVNSDKLDELVNLVGELVIVQSRLAQISTSRNDVELINISEEVERLTWSLRDSTLNIRMLTIGTTFSKFKRLVRDLSEEIGKEVELSTSGGETELDKTVIEKLNDPLVHIIRNSIDHGIELPQARIEKGKNPIGKIHLAASQSGGEVFIKISDDGAGLNKDRIYQKALEKHLILADREYSENEIYNFIFLPGFSTAASITKLSGRGVGMDVVKRSLETLRGSILINSELDKGTDIILKLPLTLAIIEGLMVKSADEYFVIPLNQVEECLEIKTNPIYVQSGKNLIETRGNLVPYISLREEFHYPIHKSDLDQIVVINHERQKFGIKVDQIIGQQQVVIKSLGSMFKYVESISGATIMGDGSVALILDVNNLILKAEKDEKIETDKQKHYQIK